MILIILAISIVILVLGIVFAAIWHDSWDMEWLWSSTLCAGSIASVASICVTVWLVGEVFLAGLIDQKIEMYEDQNAQIEERVAISVEKYMQYEEGIFTEVKPEDSITFVTLYPELKSDKLIEKQIGIYVSNNQMISELKEQRINASKYKWWLYFGK